MKGDPDAPRGFAGPSLLAMILFEKFDQQVREKFSCRDLRDLRPTAGPIPCDARCDGRCSSRLGGSCGRIAVNVSAVAATL
jgi:hypothetical protein